MKKNISALKPKDFAKYPVWEWDLDSDDDHSLFPIKEYPIKNLDNRIVGIECTQANGHKRFCILSNLDLYTKRNNEHFVLISIWANRKFYDKPRYFDPDYKIQLRKFLVAIQSNTNEVFPLKWNIDLIVHKSAKITNGAIPERPKRPLSQSELIDLAVG